MLYKIRSNPVHFVALPVLQEAQEAQVPVRVIRSALVAHRYSFVAEPHSAAGLSYLTQSWWERVDVLMVWWHTTLMTACSKVVTGRSEEQDQCFFVCLSSSFHFDLPHFSLTLPFFNGFVLWSWGLWTARVHPISPSLTRLLDNYQ